MKKYIWIMSLLIISLCMSACSGGGGGSESSAAPLGTNPSQGTDTPTTTSTQSSVNGSVTIAKPALALNETTTVKVVLKKTDGTAAAGVPVNFSTTLGTLTPSTAVTTDATGLASVQLTVGAVSGQGQVTATATVDSKLVSFNALFSVSLPPLKLSPITLGLTNLSYGGSTSVSVSVLDSANNPFTTQEVDVVFTSTQTSSGNAKINTPVRTINGVAATTYQAITASGSDTITASISGSSVNATVSVTSLTASSIQFVSALPANIGLKGMGGAGIQETSVVKFKVLDTVGQPKANQQVNFTLNTTIGGLSLLSPSGSTATDGTVSVIVQSGTIATSVRVTATIAGISPAISTQSDQLVVSTGVPAQDGFSISIETLNPECWTTDGVTNNVTARLSDHFHNPVPNGTAVYFTTSGGSIQSSCTTTGGACSVIWTSQNPRPIKPGSPSGLLSTGALNDGRAVILAYAVGEEAFVDTNGNGVADAGEFTDTTGAFRDDNESAGLNTNEPFIPFKQTGVFDLMDGRYNGVLQNAVDIAANIPKSKHVFSNSVIVMSSTVPSTPSFSPTSVSLAGSKINPVDGAVTAIPTTSIITLTVTDVNGNVMPAGTVIKVAGAGTVLSSSFTSTVPNTTKTGNGITIFSVPVTNISLTSGSDALIVTVTAPSGQSTIYTLAITY